ncbi:MAG: 6-bladed beta-propeller [Nitrosopumilus sp.]|nr:6-bladed beta-propeller [Nitrosopumilus sp.]
MKLSLGVMILSVTLFAGTFTQASFALGDYDLLSEFGSFGISKPGHFSHPQFIAVGDDGSVFVSDLGNKRIQKLSSNGEFLAEWGQGGKLPGEFFYPTGIAVSNDSVFVVDRDLNRIQKFTHDGEFVSEWGKKGVYGGQFMYPNGIAIFNDIVYVVDTGNQRIQSFTTDGEFLSSFGSSGLGAGQFLNIVGIDLDGEGNIYITDKGNSKIEKFSSSGEYLKSFSFYANNYVFSPEAIAVDPSGEMFIVNSATNRILHLPQNSSLYLDVFDQKGPYPDSFDVITDLTIGINGELFVVDSANHKIKSFETEFYKKPLFEYVPTPQIIEDYSYDKTKPEITAPVSLTVEAEDYLTTVNLGEATATDDSGIKAIINNAPDGFSPGVSNVIWVAFDYVGYSATAVQTVTVNACGNDRSHYNIIMGTDGDDIIMGTDGDDLIFGLKGNDLISGGYGNDCIFGGYGDDVISGDEGDDTIRGNYGSDVLKGQSGNDIIFANSGIDIIDGGANSDRCYSDDTADDLVLNCEE